MFSFLAPKDIIILVVVLVVASGIGVVLFASAVIAASKSQAAGISPFLGWIMGMWLGPIGVSIVGGMARERAARRPLASSSPSVPASPALYRGGSFNDEWSDGGKSEADERLNREELERKWDKQEEERREQQQREDDARERDWEDRQEARREREEQEREWAEAEKEKRDRERAEAAERLRWRLYGDDDD